MAYEIVVVGTSWGGLHALGILVGGLPASLRTPVVIVQHRSRGHDSLLAELLTQQTSFPVHDAEDKESLATGHIYLAPPDYHLLVERGYVSLTTDPLVRFSRPSIDVTFESAADSYGAAVIGVILTGANDDGAAGLARIAGRRGYAIVQDPATAESPIMPAAAERAVPHAQILPLEQIAPRVAALTAEVPHSTRPVGRRTQASP
ncbi:MAG: chemotaxis protein CheB [Gemmatimonadota bacterium]|nr:chemotaxis protein CheB [Gemmatimonadota bacterium]